jgi:prepilin-type N-terminal cleavage/methylation domain-containing protein
MSSYSFTRGFSLIEVLASCVVLSVAALSIVAMWRLADYKTLLARLDHRADRILREYYELQTFAPAGAKPFNPNLLSDHAPADPVTGFLYHPVKTGSSKENPAYDDLIAYTITSLFDSSLGTSQLVLTYIVPGYGRDAAQNFTKTVTLNPLPSPSP